MQRLQEKIHEVQSRLDDFREQLLQVLPAAQQVPRPQFPHHKCCDLLWATNHTWALRQTQRLVPVQSHYDLLWDTEHTRARRERPISCPE